MWVVGLNLFEMINYVYRLWWPVTRLSVESMRGEGRLLLSKRTDPSGM